MFYFKVTQLVADLNNSDDSTNYTTYTTAKKICSWCLFLAILKTPLFIYIKNYVKFKTPGKLFLTF